MSPDFSNPQTTVRGINFAIINREINRTLLIYQEAVRNFNQKRWSSSDNLSKNINSPQIQAGLEEDGIRRLSTTTKPAESLIGFRKNIPGLSSDLTVEEIQEFQQIAKEDYSMNLTNEQAIDQATKAVMLGQLLDNLDLFEVLEKPNKKGQNGGNHDGLT